MRQHYQYLVIFAFFLFYAVNLNARIIPADPSNYTTFLSTLSPDDTLLLSTGQYIDFLNLRDLSGTEDRPIVILGVDTTVVFVGKACCNTVSLVRCSFIKLENFKIDGKNIPHIDAIKAEGHAGNWTNDITVDGIVIVGHGATQQTNGISTKCPSWNWVIRKCNIRGAGTGMYLGNSDGEQPFVNGLIEFNVITNTVGYNLQIKRQNANSRNIRGMVLDGQTIIRHNVFSKEKNGSSGGGNARPNLLVGHFPPTGNGQEDLYLIYGNFFWQNPNESLFQGTGNIVFYNNIGYNDVGGFGFSFQPHNGVRPRKIWVFNNTSINRSQWGIRLFDVDSQFDKYVTGNFVLSDHSTPLRIVGQGIQTITSEDNIEDNYNNYNSFVENVSPNINLLNVYPNSGSLLRSNKLDSSEYSVFEDYDLDFNGQIKSWEYRGAYDGEDENKGWKLALEEKWLLKRTTDVQSDVSAPNYELFPNPTTGQLHLRGEIMEGLIEIYSINGQLTYSVEMDPSINISHLNVGIYMIKLSSSTSSTWFKIVKQ